MSQHKCSADDSIISVRFPSFCKWNELSKLFTIKRGALHSLEKAYAVFSEEKDLYVFLMDFLENKRIFAKGVRSYNPCLNK